MRTKKACILVVLLLAGVLAGCGGGGHGGGGSGFVGGARFDSATFDSGATFG